MTNPTHDQIFMAAAIRLSRRHLGLTAGNPSVGCLIVRDDGQGPYIVGHGVTALGGRPHAEPQALEMAGEKARGATAYVSLEPCSHYGKTPPCADALVRAGIQRVVVALVDPDKRVSGQGLEILRNHNVQVTTNVLPDEAQTALAAYLSMKQNHRPLVTLKLALSVNNAIGIKGQGQIAITNQLSQARSHIMRCEHDAILIGIGTALADDPMLTCRLPGLETRSPVRIVLDRHLRLPLTSRLVQSAKQIPLWIFCASGFDQSKAEVYRARGVEIIGCDYGQDATALHEVMKHLYERHINSVLVEGGRHVALAFHAANLVDQLALFRATKELPQDAIMIDPNILQNNLDLTRVMQLGDDRLELWQRKSKCLPE